METCIITGLKSIQNDDKRSVMKAFETAANQISSGNAKVLNTMRSFLKQSNRDFFKYLTANLKEEDFNKGQSKIGIEIKESDLVGVNKNVLIRLIKEYYKKKYPSINNSVTSNDVVRRSAVQETFNIIKQIYLNRLKSEVAKTITLNSMVGDIQKSARTNLLKEYVDVFVNAAIATDSLASEELRTAALEYKRLRSEISNLTKKYNASKDKAEKRDINKEINNLNFKIDLAVDTLVNKHSSEIDGLFKEHLVNYYNFYRNLIQNPVEWLSDITNYKEYNEINLTFDPTDIVDLEDQLEIDNENTDDENSKDTFAQSWDEGQRTDYLKNFDIEVKIRLSTIPKYTVAPSTNNEGQKKTDNPLGIAETMSFRDVIIQLTDKCDYGSAQDFLNSIDRLAQTIPNFYGIKQFFDDIKNNHKKYSPNQAGYIVEPNAVINKIYKQLDYYKMTKEIITIKEATDEAIVEVSQSNNNINSLYDTMFNVNNDVNNSHLNVYSENDKKYITNLLNNYRTKGFTEQDIKNLTNICNRYFPNLNTQFIRNVATSQNINDKKELLYALNEILNAVHLSVKSYNDARVKATKENSKNARNAFLLRQIGEQNINIPETIRVNKRDFKINANGFKACVNLAKVAVKFNDSTNNYNSANAEGNQASDLFKNSWLTKFFQLINYNVDGNAVGLHKLYDNIHRDGNTQYEHSNVFYGVEDLDGNVIIPGLYDRKGNIAGNATQQLSLVFADGVKNESSGVTSIYKKQARLDYFITNLFTFLNPRPVYDSGRAETAIGGQIKAGYFMRPPSDAPKNHAIEWYRLSVVGDSYVDGENTVVTYKNSQMYHAFTGKLLGDIKDFVNNLNNIIEYDESTGKFFIKQSTKGLISKYHYNGSIAEKKNGKYVLTGNIFKNSKLFNVNQAQGGVLDIMQNFKQTFGIGENGGLFNIIENNGRLEVVFNENSIINVQRVKNNINDSYFTLDNNFELKDFIRNSVEQWMTAFEAESLVEFDSYMRAINSKKFQVSNQELMEFLFNSANMNMEMDLLFEGDTRFYRDSQTFFKRTKEGVAGGENFECYSLGDDINTALSEVEGYDGNKEISLLDGVFKTFERVGNTIVEKNATLRNGFYGVTIKNTVRPSDRTPAIYNEMKEIFKDLNYDENEAHEAALELARGFGFAGDNNSYTTVNDAQSYITFDEWIRRRWADGTINEYQDLIKTIQSISETDRLSPKLLKEINAKVQVNKNFYYDIAYDPDTRTHYPRQIKNAEFVLIPQLLPQGSSLRRVYDIMKRNDIGQLNTVETSKAGNRAIFELFDEKTGELINNGDDFERAIKENGYHYVDTYYYRNLYKQQDVAEHSVDAKNKAGIQIMKKMVDNYHTADEGAKAAIETMLDAYAANIKLDTEAFFSSMGWKLDTDGEVKQVNPSTGELESTNLNFDVFYDKARQDAKRLGLDRNFLDFLTPTEDGKPKMPDWLASSMYKRQSIAQSLINNAVTRQKLPGWHAAQVTGVGYSSKLQYHPGAYYDKKNKITISEESYLALTEEEQAKYEQKQAAYLEVYLPRWSNLIPRCTTEEEEKELLRQMEQEGLDIHIGYRIPTEGKQSVSILKVKGFTHEALGSTIIVADEWVTQTGSDFDVDSVYGISYEMYASTRKNKDGKDVISLHKIKPIYDLTSDEAKEQGLNDSQVVVINNKRAQLRYRRYILDLIGNKKRKDDLGNDIDNKASKINERYKIKNNPVVKEYIDTIDKILTNNPKLATNVRKQSNYFKDKYNPLTNKVLALSLKNAKFAEKDELVNALLTVSDIIRNLNNTGNVNNLDSHSLNELYRAIDEDLKSLENDAKSFGLKSFEDFQKMSIIEQQSKQARNNMIVDSMVAIMNSKSSRRENYSRSKFTHVTEAKNKILALWGENSALRSPYNPKTNFDNQESAMGGAQLKAISVSWDNITSIFNKLQMMLTKGNEIIITYPYDEKMITNLRRNYTEGEDFIINGKESITFIGRKLGWSNTNNNIENEIVTVYGSETTAHAVDAVKEGAVPNVNTDNFGIYKIFLLIGANSDTAMNFMMQPIVKELVTIEKLKDSVYFKDNYDSTVELFRRLAIELNQHGANIGYNKKIKNKDEYVLIDENSTDYNVREALFTNPNILEAFNRLFGVAPENVENGFNFMKNKFGIDFKKLNTRIAENNINYVNDDNTINWDKFVTDLSIISIYDKLNQLTQKGAFNISKAIRFSNPDKFGAKQDIKSTREVINEVEKARDNDELLVSNITGKNYVETLYPINESTGEIDEESSLYKSLASFYKYTTIPSVKVNSQLFTLEGDKFPYIVEEIESIIGRKFTTKEYKEYQQYLSKYLINTIDFLRVPLTLRKGKIENQNIQNVDLSEVIENEVLRLHGIASEENENIHIEDINHPTEKEIDRFNKLTPAQKVIFIKRHFIDDSSIFNSILSELSNSYLINTTGVNKQKVSVNTENDTTDRLGELFEDAFKNDNPLVKLTAIDLIKYAMIVDGFSFSRKTLSKIINTESIVGGHDEGFMDMRDIFDTAPIEFINDEESVKRFIYNYIRSHSNLIDNVYLNPTSLIGKNIEYIANQSQVSFAEYVDGYNKVAPKEKKLYDSYGFDTTLFNATDENGLVTLDTESQNNNVAYLINKLKLNKGNKDGQYITITRTIERPETSGQIGKRDTVLYQIRMDDNIAYLVPINKLDENEVTDYSFNNNNNKFQIREYYLADKGFISSNKLSTEELLKMYKENKPNVKNNIHKYTEVEIEPRVLYNASQSNNRIERDLATKIINDITNVFEITSKDKFRVIYEPNYQLASIINPGESIVQEIEIDGVAKRFEIRRVDYGKKAFIRNMTDAIKNIGSDKVYSFKYAASQFKENNNNSDVATSVKGNITNFYVISPVEGSDTRESSSINLEEAENPISTSIALIRNELNYQSIIMKNQAAERFYAKLKGEGINLRSNESVLQNYKAVYKEAANYYRKRKDEIVYKLNNFNLDGDSIYSVDEVELYNRLIEYPNKFHELSKLLLEAKTFKNRLEDLYELNLGAEDAELNTYIQEIKKYIDEIVNNPILNTAFKNMFDIYFAKNYSTNPYIREGLLTLREQFGDTDMLDSWFSDSAELNNSQVQTIVKAVYHVMDTASMITIPKMQQQYDKELKEILDLPGEINYSNVVNDYGELYTECSEQFAKDWQAKKTAVEEAKSSSPYSLDYYKKLLDKNKFEAKYVIQRFKKEYYDDVNTALEQVILNAGEEFAQYSKLREEIYELKRKGEDLTEDEIKKLQKLQSRMKKFTSKPNVEMIVDEASIHTFEKMTKVYNAIKAYRDAMKGINKKYFNNIEEDNFREVLRDKLDYIRNYDREHPSMTIEDKLNNEVYAENYKWLRENSVAGFSDEATTQISKMFAKLAGDKTNGRNSALRIAKETEGGIDIYSRINPLAFSRDDILELREETINRIYKNYGNSEGDTMLIKNVPIIPITKKSETTDKKKNDERLEIIRKINNILSKAVNKDGNYLDIHLFFNDEFVTNDEREELVKLYKDLREVSANIRDLADAKSIKKKYTYQENRDGLGGYNEMYDYFNSNLKDDPIKARQFRRIFQESGELSRVPNSNIFGYLMPTDDYIDTEKTNAREYINKNLEYTPTEYYYTAKAAARKAGFDAYNQWYQDNHVYNPYTRKWEPLSIWTEMRPKVGGELDNENNYDYNPINGNYHREIFPEYDNSEAYNNVIGTRYNKEGDTERRYANPINLNEKERRLLNFYKKTLVNGAANKGMSNFIRKGYAPRQFKQNIDKYFIGKTALQATGMWFTAHQGSSGWEHEDIGFEYDRQVKSNMLQVLKAKGWKSKPKAEDFSSEAEYQKALEDTRKHNRELEKAILDKDWNKVFRNYIEDSELVKAKESVKDYLYLLAEDLKQNRAYATKGLIKKEVSVSHNMSYEDRTYYNKTEQIKTTELIKNFARRIIYDEYHKKSIARDIANTLQSIASAKFMILNLHGGIANVGTGLANMTMEGFAEEYFGNKHLFDSIKQYIGSIPKASLEALTKQTGLSKEAAMIRYFNVVNYEELNRRGDEGLAEWSERVRNSLYFMLSGGEHFMQNSAMFAMCKSHKVYRDKDTGKIKIGSYKNYLDDIEDRAMRKVLKHDENLLAFYESTRNNFKNDKQVVLELTTYRKDPIRMFMNTFRTRYADKYDEIWKKYNEVKKDLLGTAKDEFNSDAFITVEDCLKVDNDGNIHVQPDKDFTEDEIKEIENQLAFFKRKIIEVNNKIHGVYNKLGAAQIEKHWFGSLVMQYHKHLYPGILKAWRYNGYYNEMRESAERGYAQDFLKFLTMDFENYENYKNQLSREQFGMLINLQAAWKCLIGSLHLKNNWSHLSEFEKSNIKRGKGVAAGMVVPAIISMLIYAGYDDDDEKDSLFASNTLYICDRLINEAYMYTPLGLATEKDTMWSSPIAANTGPNDLIKLCRLTSNYLFDPNFNPVYKTGLYKGKNKFSVLIRRQVPALRGWDRILMCTRNNNYYKIGDNSNLMKWAKITGDAVED